MNWETPPVNKIMEASDKIKKIWTIKTISCRREEETWFKKSILEVIE